MKSQYTKICERYEQAKTEYVMALHNQNHKQATTLEAEILQLSKTLHRVNELASNGWKDAYTGNYSKAEIYSRITFNEAWKEFIDVLGKSLYMDKIINWINKILLRIQNKTH